MRAGQAILLMVLLGSLSIAAGAMNNEDVVKLVKAGISENLIISTIETSETDFDTSADALIKMKEARVPEAIIQRMIRCPDTSETRNDPTGLHI